MNKPGVTAEEAPGEDVRSRIVAAAAALIAAGGREAATTRAVATAAAVQPPTIYRLFRDKRGLLDAVAEYGLAQYVAQKSMRGPHSDPVQDLRDGWDMHVAFGLDHPGLFAIMSGDLQHSSPSPAVEAGLSVLKGRIRNIAKAGRLRVSEARALALVQSVCVGTVLTLLGVEESTRDNDLSIVAREAVMAAITGEIVGNPIQGPSGAAAALRALLDLTTVLSPGEMHLLEELLERIANSNS